MHEKPPIPQRAARRPVDPWWEYGTRWVARRRAGARSVLVDRCHYDGPDAPSDRHGTAGRAGRMERTTVTDVVEHCRTVPSTVTPDAREEPTVEQP